MGAFEAFGAEWEVALGAEESTVDDLLQVHRAFLLQDFLKRPCTIARK